MYKHVFIFYTERKDLENALIQDRQTPSVEGLHCQQLGSLRGRYAVGMWAAQSSPQSQP